MQIILKLMIKKQNEPLEKHIDHLETDQHEKQSNLPQPRVKTNKQI